jgi:catechol 2,3-dioxygenase-like lactoylglutathione lyase family enzyme
MLNGGWEMKFASVCLITKNVPALVSFYTDVLGVEAQGDDEHAELRTRGAGLTIFSTAGMERMAPSSMQDAGSGSVILMFEVDDVDAEYVRLKDLGVGFVKPPQTHPWGSSSVWFRDPDGNVIDFYSTPA